MSASTDAYEVQWRDQYGAWQRYEERTGWFARWRAYRLATKRGRSLKTVPQWRVIERDTGRVVLSVRKHRLPAAPSERAA